MKRALFLGLLLCGFAVGANAQAVDADVCAIVKNPTSFDGKIVRIKGIAFASYDQFIVKSADVCGFPIDGIWLEYPTGTHGKAGPAALVTVEPARNYSGPYKAPTRTAVTLDKSKDFKQFDSILSTKAKVPGACLGCVKSMASATFVGRLDAVANANLKRDKDGKVTDFGGFGNANSYPARLVLQSVSEVTEKPIDYSKVMEPYKDMKGGGGPPMMQQPGMADPIGMAQNLVKAMAGMPAADTVQKDVANFGKPGDKNSGVVIGYGPTDELPKEEVGPKDAPDGVLYNVTMNLDRLDNKAQALTVIHAGHHISDLKTAGTAENPPLFVGEYNSWTMTVFGAVMGGERTLGLPAGELVWNAGWEQGVRNDNIDKALRDFLAASGLSQ